ncbi:MAG TPA: hypothetical protein VLG38_08425 [Gammaproteobacteria bacterium]|nr:hypothetical protein [Gammaproteobacteria bacterium]
MKLIELLILLGILPLGTEAGRDLRGGVQTESLELVPDQTQFIVFDNPNPRNDIYVQFGKNEQSIVFDISKTQINYVKVGSEFPTHPTQVTSKNRKTGAPIYRTIDVPDVAGLWISTIPPIIRNNQPLIIQVTYYKDGNFYLYIPVGGTGVGNFVSVSTQSTPAKLRSLRDVLRNVEVGSKSRFVITDQNPNEYEANQAPSMPTTPTPTIWSYNGQTSTPFPTQNPAYTPPPTPTALWEEGRRLSKTTPGAGHYTYPDSSAFNSYALTDQEVIHGENLVTGSTIELQDNQRIAVQVDNTKTVAFEFSDDNGNWVRFIQTNDLALQKRMSKGLVDTDLQGNFYATYMSKGVGAIYEGVIDGKPFGPVLASTLPWCLQPHTRGKSGPQKNHAGTYIAQVGFVNSSGQAPAVGYATPRAEDTWANTWNIKDFAFRNGQYDFNAQVPSVDTRVEVPGYTDQDYHLLHTSQAAHLQGIMRGMKHVQITADHGAKISLAPSTHHRNLSAKNV